ncbi:conserved hypothetical protein (apicoplast) [Theileria equi strain WA]|uniref:S5 DRBM domain-containing protein n=1 Tax=Theileria equi strain WA TaxID=1537102 RepID=L1L8X1_THEEQ|nr:conserved hypothetical protein [Theileria equi strain WA]EKX71956.1 conserved hypothetical protein [Theileria equi strain WA]|eukprot:XP_025033549.1 conserved hypothetical protein (apicoplast) [Theileria equi strain WA]
MIVDYYKTILTHTTSPTILKILNTLTTYLPLLSPPKIINNIKTPLSFCNKTAIDRTNKNTIITKLNRHITNPISTTTNTQPNLNQIILLIQKTSITLKTNRLTNFKVITGIGNGTKWVGIGQNKNKLLKTALLRSGDNAYKNIYNLKPVYNDYKNLKYKGSKFKIINKPTNIYNLNTYNNLTKLSGDKKIKLIPIKKGAKINTLKAILKFF